MTQPTRAARSRAALIAAALAIPAPAWAIPLFARQTGMPCAGCHIAFPELNAFGRQFKLRGYTLGERQTVPLAAMAVISANSLRDNHTHTDPLAKNGSLVLQTASVFTGGKITEHAGAFVQWTYDNLVGPDANKHFSAHSGLDNVDLRYSNTLGSDGFDLLWGLTVHNAPGVQDVWNAVPAWGFPYMTPSVATVADPSGPDPTFLDAQPRVTGLGLYGLFDNRVYAELSAYRSSDKLFSILRAGNVVDPLADRTTLKGYNPYWRLAYTREWGVHALMLGYTGVLARQYQDFSQTDQPTTRYVDHGINGQYQYTGDPHTFSAQFDWIEERRRYDYDFNNSVGAAPAHDAPHGRVQSFKAKVSYYYDHTYGGTLGYFSTRTSTDATAYGANSLTNRGDTRGVIAELNYTPIQYLRLSLQYTGYLRYFGGATYWSTDANGVAGPRAASANNTLYAYAWFAYAY